ncbi:hypothetical protein FHS21_002815 [Phyllobacterium trifolii]|uniref:Uncharacterized protein n=1 Tax=Phyllobacterium trifolii TaxID=300193 RepID=A0A839UBR0_9HYPH|nr:hypothetical protein [Phyllobacterium trifolii]MBB3146400.1 hypothetical protein [Phyllobacterium trifolii]
MKRFLLTSAAAVATLSGLITPPAFAKDTSFAFKGTYNGTEFSIDKLSAEDCAKLLAKTTVAIRRNDGARQIVPATDVEGRQCIAMSETEEPDNTLRFKGFPPVKVYNGGGSYGSDRIQVGDGPKVDLSMGAQQWTWEDAGHSYYMVDNLSVTDKKTGKDVCYQQDPPQFSCEVNPVVKKKGKKK